ncbi:MAG: D-2-hydroxyacid dehydrogenase [Candidatus Firestonebacteria bacterium]
MKIVVLDGYALNPGEFSWESLKQLGELVVYDRTPAALTAERCKGAEIVLSNKATIGEKEFAVLPDLKFISVLATGYNIVDTAAAKKRGIIVSNIPEYGTYSVAQMVFAHILAFCQHVQHHSDETKQGRWAAGQDWCFWDYPLIELAGKTMGIIGFGRIGRTTGDIAQALGMKLLAYDLYRTDQSERKNFEWADSAEQVLAESDFISLHCNLTEANKGMINYEALKKMKRTAFLVNTSRGPLIDEADLLRGLNEGLIAGAGLDVLCVEPPAKDNPLYGAKNIFITPHISWGTKEARSRLMEQTIKNVKAYIAGKPIHIVNK